MEQVIAALAGHYGLHCERLEPLTGGFVHQVWRAETGAGARAVKLYRGPGWAPEAVAPTLETQNFAAEAGLPVPAVHRTGSGDWLAPAGDGWLAVSDFAPGERVALVNAAQAREAGVTLARLHRVLAALPAASAPSIPETGALRELAERLLRQAQAGESEGDRLAAEAARCRLDVLSRYAVDPGLYDVWQVVHADYYPANLLFGPDGRVSAVLDWDFCSVRWRGMEVARTVVETALTPGWDLDEKRARAFLAGYTAEVPLTQRQRAGMYRLWFDYLLGSLYPLPLLYQPGAVLPQGWAELARRRHRMLVLLDRRMADLQIWST